MPDGSTHPTVRKTAQAVRTLFSTEHPFDAGMAGYDGPTSPSEGGVEVVFDGRSIATVTIYGQEGEVSICGYAAIKQIADAFLDAEAMAKRMAV